MADSLPRLQIGDKWRVDVEADEPYGRIWGIDDLVFWVTFVGYYLAPWGVRHQMYAAGLQLDKAGGIFGNYAVEDLVKVGRTFMPCPLGCPIVVRVLDQSQGLIKHPLLKHEWSGAGRIGSVLIGAETLVLCLAHDETPGTREIVEQSGERSIHVQGNCVVINDGHGCDRVIHVRATRPFLGHLFDKPLYNPSVEVGAVVERHTLFQVEGHVLAICGHLPPFRQRSGQKFVVGIDTHQPVVYHLYVPV